MVVNFEVGGVVINVLVGVVGFELKVVVFDFDWLIVDFIMVFVMIEVECFVVFFVGVVVVEFGFDLFVFGEMGIGNLIVVVVFCVCSFGGKVVDWVGFGIGVDVVGVCCKVEVVDCVFIFYVEVFFIVFEMFCCFGGCEIVVIVGVVLCVW